MSTFPIINVNISVLSLRSFCSFSSFFLFFLFVLFVLSVLSLRSFCSLVLFFEKRVLFLEIAPPGKKKKGLISTICSDHLLLWYNLVLSDFGVCV